MEAALKHYKQRFTEMVAMCRASQSLVPLQPDYTGLPRSPER